MPFRWSKVLPNGSAYGFTRYQMRISTANRRVVSVFSSYDIGTFFSRHRRVFELNLGIRPMRGLLLNINNEWNRVELREGKFRRNCFGSLRTLSSVPGFRWSTICNTIR
jgi:hypothetical protein